MSDATTTRESKVRVHDDFSGSSSALDARAARRGRAWRRAGIAFLAAVVGLNLVGVLNQRTASVRAEGSGYTLSMLYPAVIRPGLDLRWEVRASSPSGFGKSIAFSFDRHYFDIIDLNSIRPDPDSSTSTGDTIVYTWNAPPGKDFSFSLDAYGEYGEHFGLTGHTSLIVDGRAVATVTYHTRWVP